ncbi:TraB/GumN family protein [Mucilaginibacter sp. UR6-11]
MALKEPSTIIAVGAPHLVGQYGLINQLRLKGYKVRPVKI